MGLDFPQDRKNPIIRSVKDIDQLPKLYIRGFIAPKGSIFNLFGGDPETCSAADVISFLESHKEDKEIVIDVSTDGGYKTEGVEIYNILKSSGKTVYGIGRKVNSIGTVVFLGAEKRYVTEDADFVVHYARIDPMDLGMEPLTAEDLYKLAEETERVDNQIVDIYCRELGEDKRQKIVAYMAAETNLGAKGAVAMGFAHGYHKKTKKLEPKDITAFAGFALNNFEAELIKNKIMDAQQSQRLTALEKMMNTVKSALNRMVKVKNQVTVALADGTSLYIEVLDPAAPDVLKGGTAYTTDADGLPTTDKAADGDYTLEDGRVITVAAGIVTEEKPAVVDNKDKDGADAVAAEVAAKEAEITALKTAHAAELNAIKAQLSAKDTEVQQLNTQFNAMQVQFTAFKKQVPGDNTNKDDAGDPPAGKKDWAKMSVAERAIAMAAEKRQQMRADLAARHQ